MSTRITITWYVKERLLHDAYSYGTTHSLRLALRRRVWGPYRRHLPSELPKNLASKLPRIGPYKLAPVEVLNNE